MKDTIRIHLKKEYAAASLEDLVEVEAVEVVEESMVQLTNKKAALDGELEAIKGNPDHLLRWDDVKTKSQGK